MQQLKFEPQSLETPLVPATRTLTLETATGMSWCSVYPTQPLTYVAAINLYALRGRLHHAYFRFKGFISVTLAAKSPIVSDQVFMG